MTEDNQPTGPAAFARALFAGDERTHDEDETASEPAKDDMRALVRALFNN